MLPYSKMVVNHRIKKKLLLMTAALSFLCERKHKKHKKPRSCWVRRWLSRRETLSFSNTLVREFENEDITEYISMFRMDKDRFEYLLNVVTHRIEKQDTLMRQCVTAREKLQVTLRYLATGK
jgi:hypothetical protein